MKLKISNRGGARRKIKYTKGAQRLLEVLWNKHGGIKGVVNATGIGQQQFVHWRNRGRVSYRHLGRVSRKLDIPLAALDYEGLGHLYGKEAPSWKKVLSVLGLSAQELEYVKAGKPPREDFE